MIPDLVLYKDSYSIYRFSHDFAVPESIRSSEFLSLTRTQEELSIVCRSDISDFTENTISVKNWRLFKLIGPLDLSLTGIIAGISEVLSQKNIPLFVISTYDTDYFLVKEENLDSAILALGENGYRILN